MDKPHDSFTWEWQLQWHVWARIPFPTVITIFNWFLCAPISVSYTNNVSKMWPLYEDKWTNLTTDLHWNGSWNIIFEQYLFCCIIMTAWLLITLCLKCCASYESFPGVASLVMGFGVQALQTNLQSCDSCIGMLVWRASNAKALHGPMSKAAIGVCSSERALPIGCDMSSGSLSMPLNFKVGRPLPEQTKGRKAGPSQCHSSYQRDKVLCALADGA